MRERGITELDIQSILRAGAVVDVTPGRYNLENWRVIGHDDDGGEISVIACVNQEKNEAMIVTVF
jgi:hypothetical protein